MIGLNNHKKLSFIYERTLGSYIRDTYPGQVNIVKAFFEYLERDDLTVAPIDIGEYSKVQNLLNLRDIDLTIDQFLEKFQYTHMQRLPSNFPADVRFIIKLIKDFYLSKGTEESFRLFFRMIFNSDVNFLYPKELMLRASDGKWNAPHYILPNPDTMPFDVLTATDEDELPFLTDYVTGHAPLVGLTSGASGIPESYFLSNDVPEGKIIQMSNVQGNFTPGEYIYPLGVYDPDDDPNYNPAKQLDWDVLLSKQLSALTARDLLANGSPQWMIADDLYQKITAQLIIFESTIIYMIKINQNGNAGLGMTWQDGWIILAGHWIGNDGKISDRMVLQDSDFYQDFSYVLLSDIPISDFIQPVLETLHPAGFKLFSELVPIDLEVYGELFQPVILGDVKWFIEWLASIITIQDWIANNAYEIGDTVKAPDGTFWIRVDFGLTPDWATDPSSDTTGLWRAFLAANPTAPTITGLIDYTIAFEPTESIATTSVDHNKALSSVWLNGIDDVDSGRRWDTIESLERYDCDIFDEAHANYLVFKNDTKVSINDYMISGDTYNATNANGEFNLTDFVSSCIFQFNAFVPAESAIIEDSPLNFAHRMELLRPFSAGSDGSILFINGQEYRSLGGGHYSSFANGTASEVGNFVTITYGQTVNHNISDIVELYRYDPNNIIHNTSMKLPIDHMEVLDIDLVNINTTKDIIIFNNGKYISNDQYYIILNNDIVSIYMTGRPLLAGGLSIYEVSAKVRSSYSQITNAVTSQLILPTQESNWPFLPSSNVVQHDTIIIIPPTFNLTTPIFNNTANLNLTNTYNE